MEYASLDRLLKGDNKQHIQSSVSYSHKRYYTLRNYSTSRTYLFIRQPHNLSLTKTNHAQETHSYKPSQTQYLFTPQSNPYQTSSMANYNKQGMGQRWREENKKLSSTY